MYEEHNIIIKNKKSGLNQLVTPTGLKGILKDFKLNKTIDIVGFADAKGRLIVDSKKQADKLYKPHINTKAGKVVPIEELKPNKDQGRDNDTEME